MDRNLLEGGRAFKQRLDRLTRRVAFLEKRTRYPGNTKFVRFGWTDTIPVDVPSTDFVIASIELDPGRWRIDSQSHTAPPVNCVVGVRVFAYDPDGDPYDDVNFEGGLGFDSYLSTVLDFPSVSLITMGTDVLTSGGRVDLAFTTTGGTSPIVGVETGIMFATPL